MISQMSGSSAQAARSGSTWRSAKSSIRTSPSISSLLSAATSATKRLARETAADRVVEIAPDHLLVVLPQIARDARIGKQLVDLARHVKALVGEEL